MVWLFAAVSAAALLVARAAPQEVLGCFLYGWKISSAIWGTPNPVNASDALHCQQICANTEKCETFGFQPTWKDCWLGSKMQVPTQTSDPSFIAGPAKCTVAGKFSTGLAASPACALSPNSNFPGGTPLDSASDFASGLVPVPLQCWPHWPTGEPALCKGIQIETLEDTATGWPGTCLGLHQVTIGAEDCESRCLANVSCASFQLVESEGLLQCWQGTGYDCFRTDAKVTVLKAKRLMRGHYRVLKDLRGFEVSGLQYAFAASAFEDVNEAVMMCNHTCLSNIGCHAWRLSTGDGCWFDDPVRGNLAYPPSTKTFIKGTEAAALVVAGEYIQRLCEVPQDLATTSTTTLLPQVVIPTVPNSSQILPTVDDAAVLPTVAPPINATPVAPIPPVTAMPIRTVPAVPAAVGMIPTTQTTSTAAALQTIVTAPTELSDGEARATGSFYKVGSGQVFYKDDKSVLHRVNGGCSQLSCFSAECAGALSLSEVIGNANAIGEDFSCGLLSQPEGSHSSNWLVFWLIGLLFCMVLGGMCCYWTKQNHLTIVRRYPWLDGYLPFQWFSARNTFTKLQAGREEGRTYRSVGPLYAEDQLPLMYPGGPQFARAGVPPMSASSPSMSAATPSPAMPPTQQMTGQAAPSYQGPMPPTDAGYDLVTVTPTGIEVTPLGEAALPVGVPIVTPAWPTPVQYP